MRKGLVLYHYWIDPQFGWMNARIQSWLPFSIQVCINGREWLAETLDKNGIGYRRHDNCFTSINDVAKAQRLMNRQLRISWPKVLERIQRQLNPLHGGMFRGLGVSYYWSIYQSEWATDTMFEKAADLAAIYRVPTKVLVQAVKRNLARFPNDFMFRLTVEEAVRLRSQIVTSNVGRGGRRYSPYAFTEHGVAMLSSVLRSSRAIQANIAIMRAFVRQRGLLASNEALARKLDALEKKYDAQFKVVFDAIRQLMSPQAAGQRTIGFRLRPGEDKLSRLRPHRV